MPWCLSQSAADPPFKTLRALFSPQAIVQSRFFHTTGTPRRLVGFIRLENPQAAEDIIERLHGSSVLGWSEKLTVQIISSGTNPQVSCFLVILIRSSCLSPESFRSARAWPEQLYFSDQSDSTCRSSGAAWSCSFPFSRGIPAPERRPRRHHEPLRVDELAKSPETQLSV